MGSIPRARTGGTATATAPTPEDINAAFVSENPNHRQQEENVNVHLLEVDQAIQRGLRESTINRIVKNYNALAIGVLTASVRTERVGNRSVQRILLLDGQQRATALKRLFPAGHDTPVIMHYGLTLAEEARLFLDLNEGEAVSAWDRFKAAQVAGEPQALAIAEMLKDLDIPLGPPKGFSAISAANRIYNWKGGKGPAALRWALQFLRETYDEDKVSYDGRVVEAFAILYHEFGHVLDTESLRQKLQTQTSGTNTLIGNGRVIQQVYSSQVAIAIAEAVITIYNKYTHRGAAGSKALPSLMGRRKPGAAAREKLSVTGDVDGNAKYGAPDEDD